MLLRRLAPPLFGVALVAATGALAAGCFGGTVQEDPPGKAPTPTPSTPTPQPTAQPTAAPTGSATGAPQAHVAPQKVDLLFSIDNSASMADKQAYLETAIPDLIQRLVTPDCLDANGSNQGPSAADGTCAPGLTIEFPPVHDMHIGIVSSSLGSRLGNVCTGTPLTVGGTSFPVHDDDQGHLLNRTILAGTTATEAPLVDAPAGFLAWFPATSSNAGKPGPIAGTPAITDAASLATDFSDLVGGVNEYGCGIESQLESWYRFLIQPDPYASLATDANKHAQWVGVDKTILQQRRDFLRPDSLVAIVVLTDENDSEIDVRSLGGQGYLFMSTEFSPPRGTSACATNPGDPACVSCASNASDPACTAGTYQVATDWGFDLNLRHAHMRAKYGLDAQFPVARYAAGLTSSTVADRNGEYPAGASSYVGQADCVNPLFAASLPDPSALSASVGTTVAASDATRLCNLTPGTRAPGDVFFAVIGGVPSDLLHYSATNAANNVLTSDDWVKILGNDPAAYDYTGIDARMIESPSPRAGVTGDWITNQGLHTDLNVDLEYACTFPLPAPRDCTNPVNEIACDCSSPAGNLTPSELSPVCDPTVPTNQVRAKAYPAIRELELTKLMGAQGIASSICPIDAVDDAQHADPLFGYRPAADAIVSRFRSSLASAK